VLSAGTAFLPSCPVTTQCSTAAAIDSFVTLSVEAVVHSECIPVPRIRNVASVVVSSLANDTLYRVLVVTSDTTGHQAGYSALVRTQDLTPPELTVVDTPPPGFTAFQLVVALDEQGVVFAGLSLASDTTGTLQPACPPSFSVSLVRVCLLGVWAPSMPPRCCRQPAAGLLPEMKLTGRTL
jgi:hypothetical protein